MFEYFLMVIVVTVSPTHSIKTEDQVSHINLTEHVKKIDEILATYQAQYRAQERKDATILANILAELSQTKQDMEKLKTSHNETLSLYKQTLTDLKTNHNESLSLYQQSLTELSDLKNRNNKTLSLYQQTVSELSDLKANHNKTLFQLSALHKSHKDTVLELSALKKSYDKTVLDLMGTKTELEQIKQRQVHNADIGFQANLEKASSVSASDQIVFDKVTQNEGGGYNRTTGYFTAPVSGSYLFWTNIVYRSNSAALAFYITSTTKFYAEAYGGANELYGTASVTTQFYLKEGEYVWLRASRTVELKPFYSSAGAVLIKQY